VPILLCAPKFLAGTMSLGDVMPGRVPRLRSCKGAFSWLVDNYPRFAKLERVRAPDHLAADLDRRPRRGPRSGAASSRSRVAITTTLRHCGSRASRSALDDGTAVVHETEVDIAPGEKVLIVGESGTGKSTLVRAIAGSGPGATARW